MCGDSVKETREDWYAVMMSRKRKKGCYAVIVSKKLDGRLLCSDNVKETRGQIIKKCDLDCQAITEVKSLSDY